MVNVRLVWICSVPDMIIPIPLILMSFTPTYIPIFFKFFLFSFVVFHDRCIFGIYQSFCFPMNPGLLQSWITFKVGKVCSTGWVDGGGIKVSLFTHSSSSLSQAASRHITTRIIASFHPDVFNFACFHNIFHPFYFLYIWILPFNECSQCQSQFTNPNTFQRLNATVTGTEKCFQYRNCVNNSFNYIDKFLYFFPFLSGCRLQYFSWTLWLVWNSNILQFASWSSDHWHLTGSSQGGNDATDQPLYYKVQVLQGSSFLWAYSWGNNIVISNTWNQIFKW